MSRRLVERRLTEVHRRLKRARHELAVIEEQLAALADAAEDARLRALVSETPLANREYQDAQRHADAMDRSRQTVLVSIAELQTTQDVLLDRLVSASPSTSKERAPAPVRVVIAEDEAIIRLDLKEILEEEGYDVVGETGRGDQAIDLVRELNPDLAILDIKMPGMDGLTAARTIAGERLAAVLILTAFSQHDLVEQARDAGALAYLVKPFPKSDLLPAIEMALGRFEQIVALENENADLAERLEARKTIDRAKGRLMDEHGMTEAGSWRFLQEKAMDTRRKIHDVAKDVIAGTLNP